VIEWNAKDYWIMGVVNITPDSFSDGGRFLQRDNALRHAEQLIADGAHILDLGAESTRPGAQPIGAQEELDRLMPVLIALRELSDTPISIDTSKPEVMHAALSVGVEMINDVRAFAVSGAAEVVRAYSDASLCVMHIQGDPQSMQLRPSYQDVVQEVQQFLKNRIATLDVNSSRLVLDPGFGFGKNLDHNIALFRALPKLVALGFPVLAGVSRKRMIGELTGRDNPVERQAGSVAAAVEAVRLGAKIVRVHDVAQTRDALLVASALGAFEFSR
jgi:dihydropteroate synthase